MLGADTIHSFVLSANVLTAWFLLDLAKKQKCTVYAVIMPLPWGVTVHLGSHPALDFNTSSFYQSQRQTSSPTHDQKMINLKPILAEFTQLRCMALGNAEQYKLAISFNKKKFLFILNK